MSDLSLAAAVSRIWNEVEGGYIIDDSRMNPTLIRGKILVERAKLLAITYAVYPFPIPGQYFQRCCFDITCEQVCNSPHMEYTAIIPTTLGMLSNRAIKYIGSVDGANQYEQKAGSIKTGSYGIFKKPSKTTYYFTAHNKIVFNNLPKGTTKGMIHAIFADLSNCECIEDDENIFIPADHISDIEKAVKLELSGFLLQRKIDKRNNTNTDN